MNKQWIHEILFTLHPSLANPDKQGVSLGEEYSLNVFHQNVPNGDDVADATCQNKEMEHGMHVFLLVDTVEYGARNVADAFGNNPPDCGGGYGVYQRFKGNQYRQSHAYKADGLQVAVILESGKTHDGSGNGASPDKDKRLHPQYPCSRIAMSVIGE